MFTASAIFYHHSTRIGEHHDCQAPCQGPPRVTPGQEDLRASKSDLKSPVFLPISPYTSFQRRIQKKKKKVNHPRLLVTFMKTPYDFRSDWKELLFTSVDGDGSPSQHLRKTDGPVLCLQKALSAVCLLKHFTGHKNISFLSPKTGTKCFLHVAKFKQYLTQGFSAYFPRFFSTLNMHLSFLYFFSWLNNYFLSNTK